MRSAILTLLLLPGLAPAQFYQPAPQPLVGPNPMAGPAALLYARLDGPPGMRSVWYQGQAKRDLAAPSVVGLRPGYVFRFEVNNLPDLPGVSLYPTLEVRGSLSMTTKAQPRDFPAPVQLTREDILAVLRGNLVTKVIYLEHPDRATPVATTVAQPLETTVPANRDLLEEAREQGRPVLVFRIGQRQETPEELGRSIVPGTLLLPGEASLSRPTVPPMLPFACWPWYDPLTGPARPDDECIHNGGITPVRPGASISGRLANPPGMRAGLDNTGRLVGLQPMDAVAEYRDERGEKRLIPSTRFCICLPRYQVLRNELPLSGAATAQSVGQSVGSKAGDLMRIRATPAPVESQRQMQTVQANQRSSETASHQGPHAIQRLELLDARALLQGPMRFLGTKAILTISEAEKAFLIQQMRWAREASSRVNVTETASSQATTVIGRISDGPQIVQASAETRSITACCHEITEVPGNPLLLFKCADKSAAQSGDLVTFTLKYLNQGGKPIREVALTDSLAARLEYVPGTAESDRDAVFTTQENEAGSQVLRWEINGVLQPGASGIVKFKVKVR